MAACVVLEEDGPLGPAGTRVWVNDPADVKAKPAEESAKSAPRKAQPKKSTGK